MKKSEKKKWNLRDDWAADQIENYERRSNDIFSF